MLSIVSSSHLASLDSIALDNIAVFTSATATERPRAPRKVASLARFEARAPRQLAGYFARSQNGALARASDAEVEAILATISTFHRAVLSLHYGTRVWPERLATALSGYTAIAIRLECADHPGVGSTWQLEQEAVERLVAKAAVAESDPAASESLLSLEIRAMRHYRRAVRAFAKAARRIAAAKVGRPLC